MSRSPEGRREAIVVGLARRRSRRPAAALWLWAQRRITPLAAKGPRSPRATDDLVCGSFPLLGAARRGAARRRQVSSAAVAPVRHWAAAGGAGLLRPLFHAGTDRANFVEEDVTELDLREQS